MYTSRISVVLKFLFAILLSDCRVESVDPFAFDPDNFIVIFEPYTKHTDDADDYTFGELKEMVKLASTRFKTLSTQSMGVLDLTHEWDVGLPEALVARAAGELNKEAGTVKTSVILETELDPEQPQFTETEYRHALSAIADANSRFPETVTRMTFRMMGSTLSHFQFAKKILLQRQIEVRSKNVAVGLNPLDGCTDLLKYEDVAVILDAIDFLFCFNSPSSFKFSDKIVKRIGSSWLKWRNDVQKINKQVDVIGRTFYAGMNNSNHKDLVKYWKAMNQWGLENHMKITMYSAFDLPYKPEEVQDSGWFKRIRNDTTNFYSFVEKAACSNYECSEFRPSTRRASVSLSSSIKRHDMGAEEAGPNTQHVAAYVFLSLGFVLFVVTMATVIYKTTPDLKVCARRPRC